MAQFVRVASRSEIPDSGGRAVEVEGKRIAIFRVGERFYAVDDECTHQGAPLSEGSVENGEVECPWHASHFDLETGEATEPPADEAVATYEVRVSGEDVEVEI
jgi:NAD(P)H-dependent nitrite reductase small subunit